MRKACAVMARARTEKLIKVDPYDIIISQDSLHWSYFFFPMPWTPGLSGFLTNMSGVKGVKELFDLAAEQKQTLVRFI